jgi:photosystem II stability/assembly factor-like uncharacterized protein
MKGVVARIPIITLLLVLASLTAACREETSDNGSPTPDEGDAGPFVDPNPGSPLPDDAAWIARPSATSAVLRGVWVSPSTSLVVAVGDGGTIVVSRDAGASFATALSNVSAELDGVWGSGDDDVFVVGAQGIILYSKDGAHTWSRGAPSFEHDEGGVAQQLRTVWGSGPTNVFVGSDAWMVYRSRDDGGSWKSVLPPLVPSSVASVWGSSTRDIYAVNHAALLISHDGGDTWSNTVISLSALNSVWASSPSDVYVAGDLGHIWHYDGSTMTRTDDTGLVSFHAVWGTGSTDVYVAGDRGVIGHTSDHGMNYALQPTGTTAPLYALHGAAGVVFAVGGSGTVLKRSRDAVVDAGADGSALDAPAD